MSQAADGELFVDVLTANAAWASATQHPPLPARAATGLVVLTCMDSRLDPLSMLGLERGDAKILRNPGARVTPEVLRSTVLARHLLGADRMMIIQHTQCAMASGADEDLHARIAAAGGPDTRSMTFGACADQEEALREDVQRIRSWPYLDRLPVGGFILDLATGALRQVC